MIKLPNEIYSWLTDSDLWRYEDVKENSLPSKDGFTALSVNILLNGSLFLCLTNKVCEIRNLSYLSTKIGKAQFGNSIATRLINWQQIQKQLKGLGVIIDNDVKSLIAHGDYMLAYETLKNCYKKLVNPDFPSDKFKDPLFEDQNGGNQENSARKSVTSIPPGQHLFSQNFAVSKHNTEVPYENNSLLKHSQSWKIGISAGTPQKSRKSIDKDNDNTFMSLKKNKSSMFAQQSRQKSQSLVIPKNMVDDLGGRHTAIINPLPSHRNHSNTKIMPISNTKDVGESSLALFKNNDAQYHLYIKKKANKHNSLMPVKVVGKQPFDTPSSNYSFQQQYRKVATAIDPSKCDNVLEFLIVVTAKVFSLEPKNCLNFFLNQSTYINNLWLRGEEEHGFKRLIAFLHQIDENIDKLIGLICSHNSEIFELFINVFKNIWKTENYEIGKLYLDIIMRFLNGFKQTQAQIALVEAEETKDETNTAHQDLKQSLQNTIIGKIQGYNQIHRKQIGAEQTAVLKPLKLINSSDLFLHWIDRNRHFLKGLCELVEKFPDLHPDAFSLFKTIETDKVDVWDILQKLKRDLNNNNQYFAFLRNMIETKNSRIFIEFQNKSFLKKFIEEMVETFLSYGSNNKLSKIDFINDQAKKIKSKLKETDKDKPLSNALKEKPIELKKSNVEANQASPIKVEYSEFFSVTKILIRIIIHENFGKLTFIKSFLDKIEKLFFSIPKVKENGHGRLADDSRDKRGKNSFENLDDLAEGQKSGRTIIPSATRKVSRNDIFGSQFDIGVNRRTLRISETKGLLESNPNNIPLLKSTKWNPQIFLNSAQKLEIVLQLFTLFICDKESLQDAKTSLGVMFRKIILYIDSGFDDLKEFLITLLFRYVDLPVVNYFLKYELFPHFQDYLNKIYSKRLILSEWEVKLIKFYLNADDLKMVDAVEFARSAFVAFLSFFDISEFIFTDLVRFLEKNKEHQQFVALFFFIIKECEGKILDIERKTSYLSKEKLYVKISELLEQQQINRKVVHLFKELQKRSLFTELIKELIAFDIPKVNDYAKLLTVYFNTLYKAFIDQKNDGLKVIPNCKAYESVYALLKKDDSDVLSKYELAAEIAVKSKGLLNDERLLQIANEEGSLRLNDRKVKNLQRIRQQMDDYREFEKYVKEGKEADERVKQKISDIQKHNEQRKIDEEKKHIIKINHQKILRKAAIKQVAKNFKELEEQKGVYFASYNAIHPVEKTVVIEFMKEYHRFFKTIFNYYSNKNHEIKNIVVSTLLVNNATERSGQAVNILSAKKFMYPSNFWRMMVDFELNKLISFEDYNNEIVRGFFVHEAPQKVINSDLQYYNILKEEKLDYRIFQEFFLNIFCRCFLTPGLLINPKDLNEVLRYLVAHCKHKFLLLGKLMENPLLYDSNNLPTWQTLKEELKKEEEVAMPENFTTVKFNRFSNSSDFSQAPIVIADIIEQLISVDVLKEEKPSKVQYPNIKTYIEVLPKEKPNMSMKALAHTQTQAQNELAEGEQQPNDLVTSMASRQKTKIVNQFMSSQEEKLAQLKENERIKDFLRHQRSKILKKKIKEFKEFQEAEQSKKQTSPAIKTKFKRFNLRKYMTKKLKFTNQRASKVRTQSIPGLKGKLKGRLMKLRDHFSKVLSRQKKVLEESGDLARIMKEKFDKYQTVSLKNCEKFKEIAKSIHEKVLEETDSFKESKVYSDILASFGPLLEKVFDHYVIKYQNFDLFGPEANQMTMRVLFVFLKNFGFVQRVYKAKEIVEFLHNYIINLRREDASENLSLKNFDFQRFSDVFYVLILHKREFIAEVFDSQKETILAFAREKNLLVQQLDLLEGEELNAFEKSVVKAILCFRFWNSTQKEMN